MKQQIQIFSYDEILLFFKKVHHLKDLLNRKESELHDKILSQIDSSIQGPVPLSYILQQDELSMLRMEARQELLFLSLEIKNIFDEVFKEKQNDNS